MANPELRNPHESPAPSGEENIYSYWTDEEHSDKRGLRVSISVAVALHVLLLTITFPQLYSEELAADVKDKKLFVIETPRFKPKPPPPPTEVPQLVATKVPIPDPTPDEPEPWVADLEPALELDFDVDAALVFNVPEAPPVPETKDVYVIGEIESPEQLHYVRPLYTEMARRARVEGLVIVKAIIDKEGAVTNLEVLKGLPLGLSEEALKAVRQWRYKPSAVDGMPVNVMLTVSVHFNLQ
jgi:protein TonB